MVSLYLHDSIGVASKRNLNLLHEVAGVLNRCSRPWVLAADWRDTPEAVASTGFPQLVSGRIVAPRSWTCNRRTIDFVMVSASLMPSVIAVLPVADPPWNPAKSAQHCSVRLLLRAGPHGHRRKVLAGRRIRSMGRGPRMQSSMGTTLVQCTPT